MHDALTLYTKISFALNHPITTVRYLLGDSEAVRNLRLRQLVARIFALSERRVAAYIKELKQNVVFHRKITKSLAEFSLTDPSGMFRLKGPVIYLLCRVTQPDVVLETGVASGISSAFVLQALNDNDRGRLYSIDLPNADPEAPIPPGKGSGWAVPKVLKKRWTLIIGRSRERLPILLNELQSIDIFLHDSEHTYENMMWEYESSWPYIKPGGLLLSDDIDWNSAFRDFASEFGQSYVKIAGLGIIRKINEVIGDDATGA